MLELFDTFASLFKSWRVVRYEQEGETYMLHISACLQDGSKLELRDYLFADSSRKYAYQWTEVCDAGGIMRLTGRTLSRRRITYIRLTSRYRQRPPSPTWSTCWPASPNQASANCEGECRKPQMDFSEHVFVT